jgi:hypothetical protein
MTSKSELIKTIWAEYKSINIPKLIKIPENTPPKLGIHTYKKMHDGGFLAATEKFRTEANKYAEIFIEENPLLNNLITTRNINDHVFQAFSVAVYAIDLTKSDIDICKKIEESVTEQLTQQYNNNNVTELILECHLNKSENIYPIKIGPVRFQHRIKYIEEACGDGRISQEEFQK